jgi:hypothetical protein
LKGGLYRQSSQFPHPTPGTIATGSRYRNVTTQATVMWQICRAPRFRGALCFFRASHGDDDSLRTVGAAVDSHREGANKLAAFSRGNLVGGDRLLLPRFHAQGRRKRRGKPDKRQDQKDRKQKIEKRSFQIQLEVHGSFQLRVGECFSRRITRGPSQTQWLHPQGQ